MDWEAIGAIGEVFGAFGVLVTLGFLLQQLRQNTRALKTDGFRNTAVMIHHPTSLIIQDPKLADIHMRGNESFDGLDPIERERYHYLMIQRVHAIELLEKYDESDMAYESLAEAGRRIIVRLATKPGFRQWWQERGRHIFGEKFTSWTQSLVDASEAQSPERQTG